MYWINWLLYPPVANWYQMPHILQRMGTHLFHNIFG